MIEKLKQELTTEREKASRRVVVPPGIPSETVDNLHVHEGSTTVTRNSSRAVDGMLMHEEDDAVESGEGLSKDILDSNSKVTFAEPGKGHEKVSSVGELGSLSHSGSGENCITGVTTNQSLSGGISDSSTTTQTISPISSSDMSVVTTRPTSLTSSVTSSSDTSPSVVTTWPTLAGSLSGSGSITSNVVSTRSAYGFGGGS